jgi:acyl carrier protein
MLEEVVSLIIETANELGEEELSTDVEMTRETELFGESGVLDSMGLVTLVVAVEQAIEDRFEKSVALADEKALSRSKSPYRTVLTLAEYAVEQLRND